METHISNFGASEESSYSISESGMSFKIQFCLVIDIWAGENMFFKYYKKLSP